MTPERMADISLRAYRHMRPWPAVEFANTLARPIALLAETDNAFVLGQIIVDEAEILVVACDPDFQRQGQAQAALEQFHDLARARGAISVFLEVAAPNTPARTLYEKLGYKETGIRRAYYRQPDGSAHDAVLMSRALT